MKITYEFVTEEISEIEVDEHLRGMLLDFDRQQYNNDHKETRRHVSLDGIDYEGELFVSVEDTEGEAERREDDLWRKKMRCQCGHAFAMTKWHSKKNFTTYTYKCYDQTRTGTVSARLKNGLSIEGVCPGWSRQKSCGTSPLWRSG